VVAGKVHFTNNVKEMEEFIPPSQILKELDGQEDWEYKYVEPIAGENDAMRDTETRDRLSSERGMLYREYENATLQWIQNPEGDEGKAIKARRDDIARRMREDYWRLDPYIRARSLYDRTRILQPGGKVEYYPGPERVVTEQAAGAANGAVGTSSDDVD